MENTQKAKELAVDIQVDLDFRPALGECPECGNVQTISAASRAVCRACDYHAGAELSQQWIDFCENGMRACPVPGVEITFAHEGEPDDFYFIVEIPANLNPDETIALSSWIKEIGGTVQESE
jgi:hypothetical protein